MELTLSTSLLISIGTLLVSAASAFAIVKTKVSALERRVESHERLTAALEKDLQHYREDERVKIAILESNQEAQAKELDEIKADVKATRRDVQEIKEAVIKKGEL